MKKPTKEILVAFFGTEDLPTTHEEIVKFVTKFMIKHHHCHTARDINRGWCFIWAYLVWCLNQDDDNITFVNLGEYGHVVLKYRNKFYDSENHHGNASCNDFRDYGSKRQQLEISKMVFFWLAWGFEKHLFKKILEKTQPHHGVFQIPRR